MKKSKIHTINIKCPFCFKSIKLSLDSNFNIISIKTNNIEFIREKDIQNALQEYGIEFG